MDESCNSSFRVYVDPINKDDGMNIFSKEVQNVKDDLKIVQDSYYKLRVSNEGIMEAHNAQAMKGLRAQLNADLDYLLRMAKQINKKFDALVAANAAQRTFAGIVDDDHTRASMISDVVANLNHIMRDFHGLRVQMEADHRQLIESRYSAITGEKATAEAINNLIAMPEHGRSVPAEAVSEIQERRDTLMDIRRRLLDLHQIFLGIATPLEAHSGGNPVGVGVNASAGLPPSPVAAAPPPLMASNPIFKPVLGTAGLNDYEKETRKQANIAIGITLVIVLFLVMAVFLNDESTDR